MAAWAFVTLSEMGPAGSEECLARTTSLKHIGQHVESVKSALTNLHWMMTISVF